MKAIMAMSKNRCIGKDGKLPFHSKDDFKWFKEFTMGKTLVVGRKTFDELPKLKGRECFIITNNSPMSTVGFHTVKSNINGMVGKHVLGKYIDGFINLNNYKELIIAGGKSIYQLFMPHITEFYVTVLDIEVKGDTYMEPFEHLFSKNEVVREFEGGKVIKYYDNIQTKTS